MEFYHATTHEAAAALRTHGADQSKIGSEGGLQAGWGFYLAPDPDAADYWAGRLNLDDQRWGEIVPVQLPPTACIATGAEIEALDRTTMRAWLRANGLILLAADGTVDAPASAAALRAHFGCPDVEYLGYNWLQIAAYLRAQGYDGYVSKEGTAGTVVIFNFSLLGPEAFIAAA